MLETTIKVVAQKIIFIGFIWFISLKIIVFEVVGHHDEFEMDRQPTEPTLPPWVSKAFGVGFPKLLPWVSETFAVSFRNFCREFSKTFAVRFQKLCRDISKLLPWVFKNFCRDISKLLPWVSKVFAVKLRNGCWGWFQIYSLCVSSKAICRWFKIKI